jgi:hypothetical protein
MRPVENLPERLSPVPGSAVAPLATGTPLRETTMREMTLLDIWLSLRRHRRMVGAVVAVAALIGIAFALLLPRQYRFTTAIEIGNEHRFVTTIEGVNQVVSDQIQPIEAPTTVISKLEKGYIPAVTAQFVAAHPTDLGPTTSKWTVPRTPRSSPS